MTCSGGYEHDWRVSLNMIKWDCVILSFVIIPSVTQFIYSTRFYSRLINVDLHFYSNECSRILFCYRFKGIKSFPLGLDESGTTP